MHAMRKRRAGLLSGHSSPVVAHCGRLEKDVRDLRRSLAESETPRPPPSSGTWPSETEMLKTAARPTVELHVEMPARSLGDVEVSGTTQLELIDTFFSQFHPQLPFLPGKEALVRDCAACPLLFWSVVAVASRATPALEGIRPRLVWPIRRLASESILQPRSLSIIQALLLLCLWPMPYASLIDDPSWAFCGIATQKALQLGLYRPLPALMQQTNGDEDCANSMRRTWVACFIVNQMLSDRFGIPTLVRLEPSILTAQMPPILRAVAESVHKDSVISSLLSQHKSNNVPPHFFNVLKVSETELESLETKHKEHDSPLLNRLLCSIKLRIYSLALVAHPRPTADSAIPDASDEDLYMANYVSKAYAVAIHVVNTSLERHFGILPDASPNSCQQRPQPCALWTFIDLQAFILAVFTLLHLVRNYKHLSNSTDISNAIQRAYSMLQACSVLDGDHFYRVCDVINYLASRRPSTETEGEPTGAEDTAPTIRPSVGIAHDVIKEAKGRYRDRRRFPEQFPDLGTTGTSTEAENMAGVAPSIDDSLQFPSSNPVDLDFAMMAWPHWDGGAAFWEGFDVSFQ
ncbi:fungal-specific transcription factor domain-containing protein [Achaetomium macrosporum]|uniref:Fungal-specific transcription factor domain-containing protein n=1 Tax=Achaetomium macrosporum TaxID=79813 RepID=A0AAN7HB19_9PEZI|nr:fungal-specific transcription factor domain-containing protein [Achaetomium macrosporum]